MAPPSMNRVEHKRYKIPVLEMIGCGGGFLKAVIRNIPPLLL